MSEPAARKRPAPAPAPAPAPVAPVVPATVPEEQYYDLSQYEHYEQPAGDDAASRALMERLNLDSKRR